MCTVSMVMDHYGEKWGQWTQIGWPYQPNVFPPAVPPEPRISQAEIDEFRSLLERARRYDKEHGEPDCELNAKKMRILALADELGVAIDFL